MTQRDLFRSPFHAVFVKRDGSKADLLQFHNKDEMRRVSLYKMRKDLEADRISQQYAYVTLNATTDAGTRLMRVRLLETLYGDEK